MGTENRKPCIRSVGDHRDEVTLQKHHHAATVSIHTHDYFYNSGSSCSPQGVTTVCKEVEVKAVNYYTAVRLFGALRDPTATAVTSIGTTDYNSATLPVSPPVRFVATKPKREGNTATNHDVRRCLLFKEHGSIPSARRWGETAKRCTTVEKKNETTKQNKDSGAQNIYLEYIYIYSYS